MEECFCYQRNRKKAPAFRHEDELRGKVIFCIPLALVVKKKPSNFDSKGLSWYLGIFVYLRG